MIAAISSKFDHQPLTSRSSALSKRAKAEPAGTTGQGGTPPPPPLKKIFILKKNSNLNVFSYLNVVIKEKKYLICNVRIINWYILLQRQKGKKTSTMIFT